MEIVPSNPFPATYPLPLSSPMGDIAGFSTLGQLNSQPIALTDLPVIRQPGQPDTNLPNRTQPPELRSANSKTRAIGPAKDRDELTGMQQNSGFVSTDRDANAGGFTHNRVAGLPYPGRPLKYTPGSPLKYSTAARQWQTRMRERGWTISVDGFYGTQSAKICRQFQQEKGLQTDGIVGPATWAAAFRSDNLSTPKPNPGSTTSINAKGLDIVKRFEGLSLTAYLDPVGIWTIGYGHTGPEVGPGDVITRIEAETLLKTDLTRFENAVRSLVKVPLTSNQFSALVSFTYNVGSGALSQSTLLARLNQRDYRGAADQFSRWVYGNGRVLPGLVTRRNAERSLFLQSA